MGKRLIGSVGLADSGVPDDLLTTKGDTHGFSSTNARIPIGDDDQVLTADSSEALGLKWGDAAGGVTPRFILGFNMENTTNTVAGYFAQSGRGAFDTTESQKRVAIDFAFQVNRTRMFVRGNSQDATNTLAFRDDGASVGAITIGASTTGAIDSGALTVTVASGSLCNFLMDLSSSSSGSIELGTFTMQAQPT